MPQVLLAAITYGAQSLRFSQCSGIRPSHSLSLQVPYRLAEPNLNLDFREIITMTVIVWLSLGDTPAAGHDSRVGFSSEIFHNSVNIRDAR